LRLWSWELWPGCDSTAPVRHRDRGKIEALGAVAIDYRNEDFLRRVHEEAGGVEVVVDSLGGPIPLRSFRAACAAGCSATAGPSSAGVGACLSPDPPIGWVKGLETGRRVR
jgi:NADPH:quinone reductase-like Zn-dependent oxidoreductase